MKRNEFLKLSLALPATLISEDKLIFFDRERSDKGFNVKSGQDRFGKSISLLEENTFYTKVLSKYTNGDMYTFTVYAG